MSGVTQKEAHEKGEGQGGCALVSASQNAMPETANKTLLSSYVELYVLGPLEVRGRPHTPDNPVTHSTHVAGNTLRLPSH